MAVDASVPQLAQLQEIALPAPVSFAPHTWGWLVVAALLLLLLGWIIWRMVRHHRARRYRRDALQELTRLETLINNPAHDQSHRTAALIALPELVKRVALSFAPRETVASLADDAWLAWLDSTWRAGSFTQGVGRWLPRLAYSGQQPTAADTAELLALLRRWIGQHHAGL